MANRLVSGCLLGIDCRYKGDNCLCSQVAELAKEHTLIAVCPEQLGGLPTPRDPSERQGDRVISVKGADVTRNYLSGAEAALRLALLNGVKIAILKSRSPSCGSGLIYDGTFTGNKVPGDGVCAGLLKKNGIRVYTEEEIGSIDWEDA